MYPSARGHTKKSSLFYNIKIILRISPTTILPEIKRYLIIQISLVQKTRTSEIANNCSMFVKATAAAFLWTMISAKPTCDQFDDEGNMLLSECLTEGQTPELAIAIGVALVLQNYDLNIFQVFRHFLRVFTLLLFHTFHLF